MKHTRLQIALVCLLLVGVSLLVLDRCAGDTTHGQTTYLSNGGGSGSPPEGGGPGSDYPPDWDSTRAPLTPEQLDSLFRALGEPDSLRERMVETYRRVWERGQDSSGRGPCGGPHRAPCEVAPCERGLSASSLLDPYLDTDIRSEEIGASS